MFAGNAQFNTERPQRRRSHVDNYDSDGMTHRRPMAGGDTTRNNDNNNHDLYHEFMRNNINTRNNDDTSNISTETPINDRNSSKPPVRSITSNVNMEIFSSPGSTMKSLNSNDKTPSRRSDKKSILYTSAVNNNRTNIHTPNNRYDGMSPIDSFQQQYQNQNHQQRYIHHESNNNITNKSYEYWVLVSGLNSNDNQSVNSLLLYFQKYGDICEYLVGKGNWLFLRFTTITSANQALSANHDIVNNNFIRVEELEPHLAQRLSVEFDTSGKLVSNDNHYSSNNLIISNTSSNNLSRQSEGGGLFDRSTDQNEAYRDFMSVQSPKNYSSIDRNPFHMSTMSPNRYLQPPVKKKDCCRLIMEVFGLNY